MSTQMVLRDLSRDVERGTCQLINGRRSDFTKLRGELGLEDSECRDDHELVALEGRMLASLKLYRKMFAQHREAFETQKSNLRAKAKEKRGAEKQQQQQQPACEDECCICMSRADSWIPQPYASSKIKEKAPRLSLVVVPASTAGSVWEAQLMMWTKLRPRTLIIRKSTDISANMLENMEGYDLVVITKPQLVSVFKSVYPFVGQDGEPAAGRKKTQGDHVRDTLKHPAGTQFLFDTEWAVLVVDEAHDLRSRKNVGSKAINLLSRNAIRKVGLTATPVTNSPCDVAGEFEALDVPSQRLHCEQTWGGNSGTIGIAVAREARTYMHIVNHGDLDYELPPCTHERVSVPLPYELRSEYNSCLLSAKRAKEMRDLTEGSTKKKTELIVRKIDRMNELCLSGKLPSVVENVVDLLKTHKQIIVVSPRIEIMQMADAALAELHPDVTTAFFTGQTSPEKRDYIIERFLSKDGERVLFLSMKAGGEGLNLVPGPTACIHIAFWWTSAAHEQASGRIHRRGQLSPVEIRYLYVQDSIEQAVLDLGDDKAYAAAIVTDTDMSLRDFRKATRRVANANSDNEKWKRTNKLLDSLSALPEEETEQREASEGEQAAKRQKLVE